jgi:hypothetical protein
VNRDQAYALVSALAGAFPWTFTEAEVGDLWAAQIQDLPFDAAQEAVRRVIRHHDRPTIKLVRELTTNVHEYLRPRALPAWTDRPVSPEELRAGLERYRRTVAGRGEAGAKGGAPDPTTRPPPEDCPDCGETMLEGRLRHAEACLPRTRAEDLALEGS